MAIEDLYSSIDKILFRWLRIGLISFSALATLVFALHQFHNPNYEAELAKETAQIDKNHAQQIAEIKQRYNDQVWQLDSICQNERKRIEKQYQPEIDRWVNAMKEEKKRTYRDGSFEGPVYKTYQRHYQTAIEQRKIATQQLDCGIDKLQQTQQVEIAILQSKHDSLVTLAKTDLQGSRRASNSYVTAAMTVFYSGKDESEFPYRAYIAWIFVLSFFITLNMEGVIYASFTILSAQYGRGFMAQFQHKAMEEEYKTAQETVKRFNNIELKAFQEKLINMRQGFEETLRHIHRRYQSSSVTAPIIRFWKRILHLFSSLFKSKQ